MPAPAVLAAYDNALPDDPNIQRKQMFGSPCAFVNRQMFFGTFEDTLVARIGPARVKALADQPGMQVFTLSPDKQWDDYIQVEPSTDPALLADLAAEALAYAAALPQNVKWPKKKRNRQK